MLADRQTDQPADGLAASDAEGREILPKGTVADGALEELGLPPFGCLLQLQETVLSYSAVDVSSAFHDAFDSSCSALDFQDSDDCTLHHLM